MKRNDRPKPESDFSFATPETRQASTVIREQRRQFNDAIMTHDAAAIGAHWLPDIQVSTSSGRPLVGKDEYKRAFERFFADASFITFTRTTSTVTVSDDGKTAAEAGEWLGRWRRQNGEQQQRGAYLASWRLIGGRWLIQAELYVPLGESAA